MKVLVCGGRDYSDYDTVIDVLNDVEMTFGPIKAIIHGGASGADLLGSRWGFATGRSVMPFKANWNLHGKAAGPIRNQLMLDKAKPDLVVAFPGGKGTADMVARAKAANVKVIEVEA